MLFFFCVKTALLTTLKFEGLVLELFINRCFNSYLNPPKKSIYEINTYRQRTCGSSFTWTQNSNYKFRLTRNSIESFHLNQIGMTYIVKMSYLIMENSNMSFCNDISRKMGHGVISFSLFLSINKNTRILTVLSRPLSGTDIN